MVSFKICPICGTRAHRSTLVCATCGTSLSDVLETSARAVHSAVPSPDLDRSFGEIDLLEGEAHRRGSAFFAALLGIILLVLAIIAVPLIGNFLASKQVVSPTPPALQPSVTVGILIETNTAQPPPVMATVTPRPPTPTETPPPPPCTHIVQPGDDLISIIFNCGHRSLDVEAQVLELNNLSSPELIQQGQEIIVPWPTPTDDPNAAAFRVSNPAQSQPIDVAANAQNNNAYGFTPAAPSGDGIAPVESSAPLITLTPTLLPGIAYHTVLPNESMVSIAIQFRTNAETLSQLNPEIPFSQCDFGMDSGGPRCTVFIAAGQLLRVPAPTPTATLSPTLTGSETATPSATPTFNAPSLISPTSRIFFLRNDLITLRWIGTGILGDNESYLVRVEDLTSGAIFKQQTRDLYFIVPTDWQAVDPAPHDYRWSIGVVKTAEADTPYYVTDPRLFTWEGRAQAS